MKAGQDFPIYLAAIFRSQAERAPDMQNYGWYICQVMLKSRQQFDL
jgi:hypothetical protein